MNDQQMLDELQRLRGDIAENVKQLALNGNGNVRERLAALIEVARSGDTSIEVLQEAYHLANELPDESERLDILVELIDSIDATIETWQSTDNSTVVS